MKLKILLPHEIFLHKEVNKLVAEGENGFFCLKPRHIDFVSALVPGILVLTNRDGTDEYFALNEGILVKCGREVLISTPNAVQSSSLEELKSAITEKFQMMDEEERAARAVIAKLEADTLRRFLEWGGMTRETVG